MKSRKLIFIFVCFNLVTLVSCSKKGNEITAVYFHGFENPTNKKPNISERIEIDFISELLEASTYTNSILPKGASIYISVHSKKQKPVLLQFIAGANHQVFHSCNQNSFFFGWYKVANRHAEEWNKKLNTLVSQNPKGL